MCFPKHRWPLGNSSSDTQSYLFELRLQSQVEQILLPRGTVKEALGEEAALQGHTACKGTSHSPLALASSYIPSYLGLLSVWCSFLHSPEQSRQTGS